MSATDTVIRWNQVNMRAVDKNIPQSGKEIVFWKSKICTGVVTERNGQPCICPEFGKRIEIKTGFLWCYQNDIEIPKEI